MSQIAFYWEPLAAIHIITMALWIGSIFYYLFGLQSCLSLLDQTQKNSVQLQSLKKLFQFNWINALIAIITQALLSLSPQYTTYPHWVVYSACALVLLMFILQFYCFTKPYRQASRSLRPKGSAFDKIHAPLQIILFLGIITLAILH